MTYKEKNGDKENMAEGKDSRIEREGARREERRREGR